MVVLQLWAILDSTLHPITTNDSGVALTILGVAQYAGSGSLDPKEGWPYGNTASGTIIVNLKFLAHAFIYTEFTNYTHPEYRQAIGPDPSSCKVVLSNLNMTQPSDYHTQIGNLLRSCVPERPV